MARSRAFGEREHSGRERRSDGFEPEMRSQNVRPVVSFIVAAHNVERYVATAIRSALAQTVPEIEVIVVDDGSRDATAQIVEEIAREDFRVVLVRRKTAGGPAVARNLAIHHACGEWLAVLDSDDFIEAERTQRLLALARCTSSDLVADNLLRFEDGTERILSCFLPIGPAPFAVNVDAIEYLDTNIMFGTRPPLGYLKPMISAEFLSRYGLRYDESLRIGEDFQLCAEALLAGARYVVFSEPLYRYRVRTDSVSRSLSTQDLDRLAVAVAGLRERVPRGSHLSEALHRYARGLERAHTFMRLVAATKDHKWSEAAGILRRPEMWALVGRFGCEAIVKRADRLRKRQLPELTTEHAQ
jgi:succinoglycan biosynthesis protein ExoO